MIGAGVTLHEALMAADELCRQGKCVVCAAGAQELEPSPSGVLAWKLQVPLSLPHTPTCPADISIRIVDLFTIKPLDAATIISCAKATGGRIITVEDHYPEGEGVRSPGEQVGSGGRGLQLAQRGVTVESPKALQLLSLPACYPMEHLQSRVHPGGLGT